MTKNTQGSEWEKRFNEKFEYNLHEMVDGDWCPALAVPSYNPYESTSTTKLKPNYSITELKGKCECGGTQKIADIKQFIAKEIASSNKALLQKVREIVGGMKYNTRHARSIQEAQNIVSNFGEKEKSYNQALDDLLSAITKLEKGE